MHAMKKRTWGFFTLHWRKIGSLSLTCFSYLPISTVALVRKVRQSPTMAAQLGSSGTACFPFYTLTQTATATNYAYVRVLLDVQLYAILDSEHPLLPSLAG